MGAKKNDILQGTLVLLILKTLASGKRMHGYAITAHIQTVSAQLLRVEEGSLYPALHRMEQEGWVAPNGASRKRTARRASIRSPRVAASSWRRKRKAGRASPKAWRG